MQVSDVIVSAVDLPPGPGDSAPTQEFEVESSLVVDDYLHLIEPAPVVGEAFGALTGVMAYRHGKNMLLVRDGTDVLGGPATLASLSPARLVLEAGVTDTNSMVLSLARPASVEETVTVACAPAAQLTCPATLIFQAGEQSKAIALAAQAASATEATVTATLGSSELTGSVRVYDANSPRTVLRLQPDELSLGLEATGSMSLEVDLPATPGGTVIQLSSSGIVSVPAEVTVPEGLTTVDFDVIAGTTAGSDTVTATLNGDVTASVTVSEGFAGTGQLISQYLEGSSGTNKVLEIVNADPTAVDLSTCTVKVYSNGNTTANSNINLDAVTLAQGETFVLCNVDDPSLTSVCDQSSGALTFNGDDAVELTCGGATQDVFGQIGVDPGSSWGTPSTANGTLLRNCDVTQGDADGSDAFDPASQWTAGCG